jgi:hypothetical protein
MKNFMYACIAVAALSFAVHCWVQPATAQAPGNPVVGVTNSGNGALAVTANGDTYTAGSPNGPWARQVNLFGIVPTPGKPMTMGQVKARYR